MQIKTAPNIFRNRVFAQAASSAEKNSESLIPPRDLTDQFNSESDTAELGDFAPVQMAQLTTLKQKPPSETTASWARFGLNNPEHLKFSLQQIGKLSSFTIQSGTPERAGGAAQVARLALARGQQEESSFSQGLVLLSAATALAHLGEGQQSERAVSACAQDLVLLAQQAEREAPQGRAGQLVAESGMDSLRGLVHRRAPQDLRLKVPTNEQSAVLSLAELSGWKEGVKDDSLFPLLMQKSVDSTGEKDSLAREIKLHWIAQPKVKTSFFGSLLGSKPQPQIEQLRTVQTFADEIAEGKASALKLEGVDQPYGDKTKPGYWESIHPSDRGWAEFGDKLTQQAKHSGSVISESVFGNLNALDKRGQRGKVMEALGMEVKSSTTFGSNQYTLYQTPESGVWQPVVVQSKPQSTNSGMTYFLPNISKAEELIQAAVSSQKKDREFELHLSLLDQSELAVYPGAVTVEGATIIGQTPEGLLPSLQGERNGGSFRVHAAALLDKGLRDTWEIAGTQAQISKN